MESGLKLRKGGQERIDSVVSSVISMHAGLCKLIPLRVSVPKSLKKSLYTPRELRDSEIQSFGEKRLRINKLNL